MADDFSDITVDASSSSSTSSAKKTTTATTSQKKEYAVSGNILRVVLEAESWTTPGKTDRLDCGSFEIDTVDFSDPPPVVSIKATAVPLTKNIRSQPKNYAWDEITIKDMATKIASTADMELTYDADYNPTLDRADQRQMADLAFLRQIAIDNGLALKVTDNKIIIFEEEKYEKKEAVMTFTRGDSRILSARFSQDTSQCVKSSTVRYKDPKSGKLVQETFEPDEPPATAREAISNSRPNNLSGDAIRNSG